MSSNDAENTPEVTAVPAADDAPPKRRRAPRKKAETPEVASADAAPVATEAAAAEAAPVP
ncbi:peptidoglycan-binding protein LysM, partial [Rubrivivax gelatinosus]|nr:peptidoglycan-binding protein LysM [Rubrivivax gelatinosus]